MGSTKRRMVPQGPLQRLKMHDGSPAAFGSIRFASTKRMPSKWCAFSNDSSPDDVVALLCETWGLSPPPVLISVTGAAQNLDDMRPKDRIIFRRGLREAARKTRAWILTGGTNTGVMKMVGNMVQEQDDIAVTCLAVAPMGCVHLHEEMLDNAGGKIFRYDDFNPPDLKTRAALDPNHSHILLVDNGQTGKWGSEIDMRAAIEDAICKVDPDDEEGDDNMPTPMVLVAVGGGPGTLKTIIATLEKKRPVVVLADAGGASTAIYNYIHNNGEVPKLSDKLNKDGEPVNKNEVRTYQELLPRIKELGHSSDNANNTQHLTFFKPSASNDDEEDSNTELDVVILEAILSDCESVVDAIMHAVRWSQPAVIDNQLQRTKDIASDGLVRALQSALLVGAYDMDAERVVKTLIDYNADCRLVDFDKLFRTEKGQLSAPDPFGVIELHLKEQAQDVKAIAKRRGGWGRGKVLNSPSGTKLSVKADGFKLLEEELEEMGYTKYLDARRAIKSNKAKLMSTSKYSASRALARTPTTRMLMGRGSSLMPTWIDLMMWAVVVGEDRLARLLWRKTDQPMRAAIMGAQMANKIAERLGQDHLKYNDAIEQAATYEQWAIDVLDRIGDPDLAVALLTVVPKKRVADESGKTEGKTVYLWKDSVMDQACMGHAPCRAFVARTNCQNLLTKFFNGDYSSSKVKISPSTTTMMLMMQLFRQALVVFTLGFASPVLPHFAPPQFVTGYTSIEEEEDDDDLDDDDIDDEYFKRGPGDTTVAVGGRGLLSDLQLAVEFWNIPRVKFYFHAIMYIVYIALYLFIIGGSDIIISPWGWAGTHGVMYPNLPTRMDPNSIMEFLLWTYLIGRIIEEGQQIAGEDSLASYFGDVWNRIDFASILIMSACFALRILIWVDVSGLNNLYGGLLPIDAGVGTLGLTHETKLVIMQFIQICFSISSLLVIIRFFDTMSINPALGELVIIVIAMLADTGPIFVLLAWSALGFGCALSALLPQGNISGEFWMRPFWYPLRAILGDFDFGAVYEILGDTYTPNQNIMSHFAFGILFLYVFVSTITIVNLMIAQMTQSYEKIANKSMLFRKYRQVDLIREYKDKRSPLPPPFIAFMYVWYLVKACCMGGLCRVKNEEDEEGFSDFMWMPRAEELFKKEREVRDESATGGSGGSDTDESMPARVQEIADEQESVRTEMQRSFESVAGRFDLMHDAIRKLSKKLDGGAAGNGKGGGGKGVTAWRSGGRRTWRRARSRRSTTCRTRPTSMGPRWRPIRRRHRDRATCRCSRPRAGCRATAARPASAAGRASPRCATRSTTCHPCRRCRSECIGRRRGWAAGCEVRA